MAEQQEESKVILEPIGERVLGEIDPLTLSREQFENSPDLLFHGAAKPFDFSFTHNYRSEEYLKESDGSQTLGAGFYTTDDREAAGNYSLVRQGGGTRQTVITSILPYQARVLDLRAKEDVTNNAPVPKHLFDEWVRYYNRYYLNRPSENIPWYIDESESGYQKYLDRANLLANIDLRVMLETGPSPILKSRIFPSPHWAGIFTEFMIAQGYDGLVYVEGGEGAKGKSNSTFVFYNLNKIGTYDSWNNK